MPDFEWFEEKRLAVLRDRRLEFLDGRKLFDGRPVFDVISPRLGEERWVSIGCLDGRVVAIVWMRRGDNIRIITMRRARREEERRYRQLYG